MTEKRLIVDEDYNIVDTVTGEGLDDTQVFDLANELNEEKQHLQRRCGSMQEEIECLSEENKWFKNKVHSVIDKRINTLENDYNQAVKSGMPSNSVYSEIELLEELKKELEE